jgi:hypothetical protein
VQWALRHLPFYGRWYRFLLFWPGCDKGLAAAYVDSDYPDQQKAVSEINEITRIMFTEWITSQVGDDAELLAASGFGACATRSPRRAFHRMAFVLDYPSRLMEGRRYFVT